LKVIIFLPLNLGVQYHSYGGIQWPCISRRWPVHPLQQQHIKRLQLGRRLTQSWPQTSSTH